MAASFYVAIHKNSGLAAASLQAYTATMSEMRTLALEFQKNWARLLESSVLLFMVEVC